MKVTTIIIVILSIISTGATIGSFYLQMKKTPKEDHKCKCKSDSFDWQQFLSNYGKNVKQ